MSSMQRKEDALKERAIKNIRREFPDFSATPSDIGLIVIFPFEGSKVKVEVFSYFPGRAHTWLHSITDIPDSIEESNARFARARVYFNSIRSQLEGLVKNA